MTRTLEPKEQIPDFADLQSQRNLHSEALAASKPEAQTNIKTTDGKVTAVTYPDGTSRKFTYDEAGLVVGIKQPDGTTWSRTGIGDEWNIGGILKYTGKVQVRKDGSFVYEDWQGDKVMLHDIEASGNDTAKEANGDLIPERDLLAKYGQKLDWDKNGRISKAELESASIQNSRGQIPLAQAHLASTIKANYDNFKKEYKDKFGSDPQVSFKDIETFSDRKEKLFKSERLWRRADDLKGSYFRSVDSNGDGRLSAAELELAANKASISAPQKEMFKTMQESAAKGKGLSWQDITAKHSSIFESSNFDNTFKTAFGYESESRLHEDVRMVGYLKHTLLGGFVYTGTAMMLVTGGPITVLGYAAAFGGCMYYLQRYALNQVEELERASRYKAHLAGRL